MNLGAGGIIVLLGVAVVFGAAAQFFPGYPGARTRFDWVIVGLVALATGLLANAIRQVGPQWDGLYVLPVLLVSAFWSVVATVALRRLGRREKAE
jgi:hypothetical protein